jgi:hypothetical protein
MIDEDKIIQIIPADGWSAWYEGGSKTHPVVCWALTDSGIVRGMIATRGVPHFAEGLDGFEGFRRDGSNPISQ